MSSTQNEASNGDVALMLLFIGLLIVKALGVDISWWIVTSPLWIQIIYFTLHALFKGKE